MMMQWRRVILFNKTLNMIGRKRAKFVYIAFGESESCGQYRVPCMEENLAAGGS